MQVHDYRTGFLVHSPAGAAYRIRYLLGIADKRHRMGQTGHEFVREHFLLTRNLHNYLTMLPLPGPPGCHEHRGLRHAMRNAHSCLRRPIRRLATRTPAGWARNGG